jgi:putative transposase
LDFVADQLFNGHRFRALTIVDNFSGYCHAVRVGKSIKGIDVVEVMEALKEQNGQVPKRIQVDNGSEFIGKELD